MTAALFAAALSWPRLATRVLRACFPRIVWYADTTAPILALTFDDGPDPVYTPAVLDILAKHNTAATFFLVGDRVREHRGIANRIRIAGHEIGNHSDTWRRTVQLSDSEFEADLIKAEQSLGIERAQIKFFRPAGGLIRSGQVRIAERHGYVCVLGSGYAFDPYRPPASVIRILIGRSLQPGTIIVLHDAGGNRSETVRALPAILSDAHRQGLRFVRLSDAIRGQATKSRN